MSAAASATRSLTNAAGLALSVPRRAGRSIGDVIREVKAPGLIAGVTIEAGVVWPDDRGFFSELFRFDSTTRESALQISSALSYPGTIKAIHYHAHQTDLWAPILGTLQMMLVDLRRDSPSFGRVNTIYGGELRPWRLRIPPGVGHGYKVVGVAPALMVYATDRFYDPADEGRIPYDDRDINYDWDTQHK